MADEQKTPTAMRSLIDEFKSWPADIKFTACVGGAAVLMIVFAPELAHLWIALTGDGQ